MSKTFFTLKIPVTCNIPFNPYLVTGGCNMEVERARGLDPQSPDLEL